MTTMEEKEPPPTTAAAAASAATSAASTAAATIKFLPWTSTVDAPFWVRYCQLKLETIKLDETPLPVRATYGTGTTATTSGSGSGSTSMVQLQEASLSQHHHDAKNNDNSSSSSSSDQNKRESTWKIPVDRVAFDGTLRGFNTLEAFGKVDKNALLKQVWQDRFFSRNGDNIGDGDKDDDDDDNDGDDKDDTPCNTFVLLTFADLKKHQVVYWFGFPAPMCRTPIEATTTTTTTTAAMLETVEDKLWPGLARALYSYTHHHHHHHHHSSSPQSTTTTTTKTSSLPAFFAFYNNTMVPLTVNYLKRLGLTEEHNYRQDVVFGFIDPTSTTSSGSCGGSNEKGGDNVIQAGWPLRNLMAFLSIRCHLGGTTVQILSFRLSPRGLRRRHVVSDPSGNATDAANVESSVVLTDDQAESDGLLLRQHSALWQVRVPQPNDYNYADSSSGGSGGISDDPVYKVVGWELNARHKPGPRSVNLRPLLDQNHLAIQAADLNLKLMKWRMIPSLNVEKLQSTKVLLLGAGTLGCSVARTLLGWGIRDFTILDYGNVSYSNPVRQNLFTLDDCHFNHGQGRPKAEAAAEALKTIAADVTARGVRLSIPMPGHADQSPEALEDSVSQLDALVEAADAVFLLTDTRESRWLPTVMAAAHDKILINAALGLDSWLVMRHGGGVVDDDDNNKTTTRLGCYFCNDVVAPENSTKNRTLDQQCTVTRPGLAPIASSMAVELLISLMHHPKRQCAPAPKRTSTDFSPSGGGEGADDDNVDGTQGSPLGVIPHQIRGSLVSYTMMNPSVPAFQYCTGCARPVIDAYKEDKMQLVADACASIDGSFLEDLSGLMAFRAEAADRLAEMEDDWDMEEEEED